MGVAEDLADALARDVIAAADELGDERLITEISTVLGASSPTTQEAYMTAIRVRLAERRARAALAARLAKGPVGGPKKEIGAGPILDAPEGGGH
jgi:cytochrome P450